MTDHLNDPPESLELGQLRPANTSNASLYSPGANTRTRVRIIMIVNTSTTSAKFRLFHDDDGTTYNQTTAIFYDAIVTPGATVEWTPEKLDMMNSSGNIAVRTDTANAFTFTLYGEEQDKRLT